MAASARDGDAGNRARVWMVEEARVCPLKAELTSFADISDVGLG